MGPLNGVLLLTKTVPGTNAEMTFEMIVSHVRGCAKFLRFWEIISPLV